MSGAASGWLTAIAGLNVLALLLWIAARTSVVLSRSTRAGRSTTDGAVRTAASVNPPASAAVAAATRPEGAVETRLADDLRRFRDALDGGARA